MRRVISLNVSKYGVPTLFIMGDKMDRNLVSRCEKTFGYVNFKQEYAAEHFFYRKNALYIDV